MYPLIVSYYTEGTPYEREVEGLIESCKKLGLETSIDPIPNFGSWEKNCCFKPKYLLQKLQQCSRPILWLDADAVVLQKPSLFETLEKDIALHVSEPLPDDHPSKMTSGTLFINHTQEAKRILEAWSEETDTLFQENPQLWDQETLRNVLLESEGSYFPLDSRYYWVYDKENPEFPLEEAFFVHFQASRTLKKTLNHEVVPFWDEAQFTHQKKLDLLNLPT